VGILRRSLIVPACLLSVILGQLVTGAVPASADVGAPQTYVGPGYGPNHEAAPTTYRQQSKLWFHDGAWWALVFDPGGTQVRVAELMRDHTWRLTDVVVRGSAVTVGDVLADGDTVHVVGRDAGDVLLVTRLTYSAPGRTYTVDTGFPVVVTTRGSPAVTIAEDTTGRLWITFATVRSGVQVTYSDSGGRTWAVPFVLPVEGSLLTRGEVSAVVSFDQSVGVMWSDQVNGTFRFAVHEDGAAPAAWRVETALSGAGMADNHLNVKVAPGDPDTVLAVVKTAQGDNGEPGSAPLIMVLARAPDGTWVSRVVSTVAESTSRPMLLVDTTNRLVHVFVQGRNRDEGTLFDKTASLADPVFAPGEGAPIIRTGGASLTDATGSKHPIDSTTGLVVLASDPAAAGYVHAEAAIRPPDGSPPTDPASDTTPPTVPGNLRGRADSATSVSLRWEPSIDGERWWPAADGVPPRGYTVLRDGAEIGTTALTSFADASPVSGRTHRYTVAAVDWAGNASAQAGPVQVEVPPAGPSMSAVMRAPWVTGAAVAVVLLVLAGLVVRRVLNRRETPGAGRWG
jgi:hypothetical protein